MKNLFLKLACPMVIFSALTCFASPTAEKPRVIVLTDIDTGLGSSEHPNYGSWGGRYEYYIPKTELYFFEPETRPLWTNAADEVFSEADQQYHTGNHATLWRWREVFQNDFAARMDWCIKSYEEANHPPLPSLAHEEVLEVREGEKVVLKAEGCSDPDGDELAYR